MGGSVTTQNGSLEVPSLLAYLSSLPPKERESVIKDIDPRLLEFCYYDWRVEFARPEQLPPTGDWQQWIYCAGRSAGKTRTAAEQVRDWAETHARCRIALVAPTAADVRDIMVKGQSGILAVCPPWNKPHYEPSKRCVTWPNGAQAFCYSAEEPDRLRGPNHHYAWGDEIAAWQRDQETYDMLELTDRKSVV